MGRRSLTLWIGILGVALSGCGGNKQSAPDITDVPNLKDFEKLVREVVDDTGRQGQAIELLGELERTIEIYFQEVQEVHLELVRAGTDYDAQPEDLEAIVQRLQAARVARRDNLIDLALRARKTLTPEEWSVLSKRRMASFDELAKGGAG